MIRNKQVTVDLGRSMLPSADITTMIKIEQHDSMMNRRFTARGNALYFLSQSRLRLLRKYTLNNYTVTTRTLFPSLSEQ